MRHSKLEQAARQLLEAAEGIQHGTDWNNGTHAKIYRPKFPAAITALREALAEQALQKLSDFYQSIEQAEQEPVAFQMICPRCKVDRVTTPCPRGGVSDCPMTATAQNAAPVRTKDLTDDEIDALIDKSWIELMTIKEFARAVIAADRSKNGII